MNIVEQRNAAAEFSSAWKNKGYEKGETQRFWIELLQNVFDVKTPTRLVEFEKQVKTGSTNFIDAYIAKMRVFIEQKSIDKDLRAPAKQSDGAILTPFQQAKRYAAELSYSERPRWIVVSNFKEFLIYDMERPTEPPESVLLENLEKRVHAAEISRRSDR